MTFILAIVFVLLHLPRHFSDAQEPAAERIERLTRMATGSAMACDVVTCVGQSKPCRPIYRDGAECAGALIQLARIESTLAAHVHRGECLPYECDRGLAVGPWQIHRLKAWNDSTWQSMHGDSVEATQATALVAARRIAGGVGACGSLAASFGRYNNGSGCAAYGFAVSASYARHFANRIRILMVTKANE